MNSSAIRMLIEILEKRFGFRRISIPILVGNRVAFDAVMIGEDPVPLVIIEHKQRAEERTIKEFVQRLKSFVWALHSQGKRHLVSGILLLEGDVSEAELAKVTSGLSGICRVFVLTANMPREKVESELLSLGTPAFAKGRSEGADLMALIEEMSSDASVAVREHAADVVSIARDCRSPNEVSGKLWDEFRKRIGEVDDASPDSER